MRVQFTTFDDEGVQVALAVDVLEEKISCEVLLQVLRLNSRPTNVFFNSGQIYCLYSATRFTKTTKLALS